MGQVLSIMGSEGPEGAIQYLTWEGHEFAESVRNDTLWKNAWGTIKEKGGNITISILKQLLASAIKSSLGLS